MMRKIKLLALAVSSYMFTAYAAPDTQKIFNPKPDKDDVIMPMPCDAMMVFRKVYTSTSQDRVKDQIYNAGTAQNNSPMSQNPNVRHVQGSLADKKGHYYLMAKYELMEGQVAVLRNQDKCESVKFEKFSRRPQVNLSYFEAMELSHQYSLYLQNQEKTPTYNGAKVFARLATDDEWEFAARGGKAVTQSQFESDLPPMENDDLGGYAWFDGNSSANGNLQLAGLKKPNPLGLYDMFGNAQEMVLEPFKAVRTGRLLGISGGICVRGGGFLTPRDSITSAYRTEKLPYVKGKDLKSKDTSTRFVLSVSVASDTAEVKKLNSSIQALGNSDESEDSALSQANRDLEKYRKENEKNKAQFKQQTDVLKKENDSLSALNDDLEKKSRKLESLSKELLKLNDSLSKNNDELNKRMDELKGKIETANAQTEAMKEVAATANLRLGGYLCRTINDDSQRLDYYHNLSKHLKEQCKVSKELCAKANAANAQIERFADSLDEILTYYGDTMADARSNYPLKLFKDQLTNAKAASGANSNYDLYVDMYFKHLEDYKSMAKNKKKSHEKWMLGCKSASKGK